MPEVHEAHNEAHDKPQPEAKPSKTLWSVVSKQGTALADHTLCAVHFADETGVRAEVELSAKSDTDKTDPVSDPLRWMESTGNDEVECCECGYPNSDEDWTRVEPDEVKVVDYIPGGGMGGASGEYSQEQWVIQIGEPDRRYSYERWFTMNASGDDWRSWPEQQQIAPPSVMVAVAEGGDVELHDWIEPLIADAAARYNSLYDEAIEPAVRALKATIFPFTSER